MAEHAATLRTVTGPLPAGSVTGAVLPHEHLVLDLRRAADREARLAPDEHGPAVAAELAELRSEFDLGLVVDLTCRGMGRDAAALAALSSTSRVPVIAATGWYYEPFHPPEVEHGDVPELTERLLADLADGMDGSGVRPGVLGEVGTHGEWPTPQEERVLRAAADAALHTGLSVATHAHLGRGGLAQLEVLTSRGLPPHRISIGHQDLLDDPETHQELARAGAYVAFDTVGKQSYQSDETRLRLLLTLLERGFAERVLLSNDVSRHGYLRSSGAGGYGAVFRSFLPALRAHGVDAATLRTLTRDNPLRFLTGGPAHDAPSETEPAQNQREQP